MLKRRERWWHRARGGKRLHLRSFELSRSWSRRWSRRRIRYGGRGRWNGWSHHGDDRRGASGRPVKMRYPTYQAVSTKPTAIIIPDCKKTCLRSFTAESNGRGASFDLIAGFGSCKNSARGIPDPPRGAGPTGYLSVVFRRDRRVAEGAFTPYAFATCGVVPRRRSWLGEPRVGSRQAPVQMRSPECRDSDRQNGSRP